MSSADAAALSGDAGSEIRALREQALVAARAAGDRRETGFSLGELGWIVFHQGDEPSGLRMTAEACHILRDVGDRDALSNSLNRSAALALEQGDSVVAQTLLEEALATAQAIGQRLPMSIALSLLGHVALGAGDVSAARGHYAEALLLARDGGQPGPLTSALRDIGGWWVASGNAARAAQVFGAEAAARGSASVESMSPPFRSAALAARYAQDVAAARAGLDAHTFAAAWAEGEAMPLDDAIADALRDDTG